MTNITTIFTTSGVILLFNPLTSIFAQDIDIGARDKGFPAFCGSSCVQIEVHNVTKTPRTVRVRLMGGNWHRVVIPNCDVRIVSWNSPKAGTTTQFELGLLEDSDETVMARPGETYEISADGGTPKLGPASG
jgi:hypothetical protein